MDEDKKIEAAGQAAEQASASFGGLTKDTKRLADAMTYLTNEHKYVTKQFTDFTKAVGQGRQKITSLGPALKDLQDAAENLSEATEEELAIKRELRKDIAEEIKAFKKANFTETFLSTAGALAKGYATYQYSTAKAAINNYQSNASAFAGASSIMTAQLDSIGGTVTGVTTALKTGAEGAVMFGDATTKVVGGVIYAGATIVDAAKDLYINYKKLEIDALAKEVDKTIDTFHQASKAGAMFAGGMTEFREDARAMRLSQDEFAAAVRDNNKDLAQFGGTVSTGIKNFVGIGKEMRNFREELLNLGISYQEQSDIQAGYMGILGMIGQGQRKDYENIAQETKEYAKVLKDLSDLTGEDVKTMRDKGKKYLEQGDVLATIYKMGLDTKQQAQVMEKVASLAQRGLPPQLVELMTQMKLYNSANVAGATAMGMSPETREYLKFMADQAFDTSTSADQMNKNIEVYAKENYKNLSDKLAPLLTDVLGPNKQLTGQLGEQYQTFSELFVMLQKQAGMLPREQRPSAGTAAKPQDELTAAVNQGTIVQREMNASINELLTKPMVNFSKAIFDTTDSAIAAAKALSLIPGVDKNTKETVDREAKRLTEEVKRLKEQRAAASVNVGAGNSGPAYTSSSAVAAKELSAANPVLGAAVARPETKTGEAVHATTKTMSKTNPLLFGATAAASGLGSWVANKAKGLFGGNKATAGTESNSTATPATPAASATTGPVTATNLPAGATDATGGKASHAVIRDLIQSAESLGYDSMYPNGKVPGLTNMSIAQVMKMQMDKGGGAIGRYQFIPSTFREYMEKNPGIDWTTTKFDETMQDKLADMLIDDVGYSQYASGAMSKERFLNALSKKWAGLPKDASNTSYYESSINHANVDWASSLKKLAKGGITDGVSIAGEAGAEAVVPLPDGRTIPVKMDVGDLVAKLDELLTVMKDHKSIAEKQLWVSA